MPELPEVETIRQYLDEVLPGLSVVAVRHLDPRMAKDPAWPASVIARLLVGQVVSGVRRRGKFLFICWQNGDCLELHLGMSGRLTLSSGEPVARHTHLILDFAASELRLVDPRRFGRVAWVPAGQPLKPELGREPLERNFTAAWLAAAFQGRRAPVKAILLDQRVIAGLGNIYADEALFRAGVHPLTPAGELDGDQVKRLVRAIRRVLRDGLAHRGTSFSDYVDALGHPGDHLPYLDVYGRKNRPCRRCGRPIATVVIQSRTSHWCPHCQPAGGVIESSPVDEEGAKYAKV